MINSTQTPQFKQLYDATVGGQETEYEFAIQLYLASGSPMPVQKEHLVGLTKICDYYGSYKESITLHIKLPLKDAMRINEEHQDLKCLVIRGTSGDGTVVDKTEYRALIKDRKDWVKAASTTTTHHVEGETDGHVNLIDVFLELVEAPLYDIHRRSIGVLLNDTNMHTALIAATELLGFKNYNIAPPDNNTVYSNLLIPEGLRITEVFEYLQESEHYDGVYDSGISYFAVGETLFVYPKSTPATSGKEINFISAPPIAPVAQGGTYRLAPYRVDIAIQNTVELVDRRRAAMENGRTHLSFLYGAQLQDEYDMVNLSPVITGDTISEYSLMSDTSGYSATSVSSEFRVGSNRRKLQQEMFANVCFQANFMWTSAAEGIILPVDTVVYINDSAEGLQTTEGVIKNITYNYTKTDAALTSVFTCVANVTLLLKPED